MTIDQLNKIIMEVTNIFTLSDHELCAIIGIAKPTLIRWKRGGSQPSNPKRERLFRLREIALNWERSGYIPVTPPLHDIVLPSPPRSLFQLLKSLDKEAILFVGNRLELQQL